MRDAPKDWKLNASEPFDVYHPSGEPLPRARESGGWFELQGDQSPDAVIEGHKKCAESEHDAKGAWGGAENSRSSIPAPPAPSRKPLQN